MAYVGVKPAAITSATQAEIAGDLTVDTNTLHVDAANNRVGVGVASPSHPLHVAQSRASDVVGLIENTNTTSGFGLKIKAGGTDADRYSLRVDSQAGTELFRVRTAGGVTFNGDTAAANALDDYEEGSFTPTVGGSTTDPSTAVEGVGRDTKIGRAVTFNILFANKTISGADGNIQIVNMPFVSTGAINAVFPIASHNMDSDGTFSSGLLTGGSTTMEILYMRDATSWQNIAIQNVINFYLYVGGSYITSS